MNTTEIGGGVMTGDEYWNKDLPNNMTASHCRNCFFGVLTATGTGCECHISRPVSSGKFPPIRPGDYCGFWTDPKTLMRPFAHLVAEPAPLAVTAPAAPTHPATKPGKKARKR